MSKCQETPNWAALEAEEGALRQTLNPTEFFGCEPELDQGNAAFLEDNVCVADPLLDPQGTLAALDPALATSSSSSSSTSMPTTTPATAAPPSSGGHPPGELDRILRDYQVREDTMTQYTPNWVGWLTDPVRMTETEAGLLDDLQTRRGLMGLSDFKDIKESAYSVSGERFKANRDAGLPGGEDGHQDAYRHIYWNVLMTREFGSDFAAAFGSAHEGVPGNFADREAMDLYNNELGRTIANSNPDATEEELQELVMQAIDAGQAVVIDDKGELRFSDTVKVGQTGEADDAPAPGGAEPPEWSGSL